MGHPKVGLPLKEGGALGSRVHAVLSAVCRSVVLVGESDAIPDELKSVPVIPDLRPGLGPLSGWEALLASGLDSDYIIVPCDLPRLSAGLLALLTREPAGRSVALRLEGREHSEQMPIRLAAAELPALRRLLDAGERKVTALLRAVSPVEVVIPPELEGALFNLNRPEDLDLLR